MGIQTFTRLNMRVVWLDEDISPIDTTPGATIKLLGVYDTNTLHTTIYLIIDYKGTEYKISRFHKRTTVGGNPDKLEHRYARSIQHFIRKYKHAPFLGLVEKFLEWSDNPAYEVLRELLPQSELADI